VADLHVVQDLGDAEGTGAVEPERGADTGHGDQEQAGPAADGEAPLDLDDAPHVVHVGLAALVEDPVPDGVELGPEGFELVVGEPETPGGGPLAGGLRGSGRGGDGAGEGGSHGVS
jgi:hypothetical protein